MSNSNRRPLITVLGGTVAGICLSLMIGIVLFYRQVQETPELGFTPIAQATDTSQLATLEPPSTRIDQIDEAETSLRSGQPEKVRELLYPSIERWTSNDDLIRGYKLLAEAELAQGHAQLAVPFLEKLYFYDPTAENLFFLATVCDTGGDIKNALVLYQELAKWENLPDKIDVEFINMRIYHISRALGTPVLTHTPLP